MSPAYLTLHYFTILNYTVFIPYSGPCWSSQSLSPAYLTLHYFTILNSTVFIPYSGPYWSSQSLSPAYLTLHYFTILNYTVFMLLRVSRLYGKFAADYGESAEANIPTGACIHMNVREEKTHLSGPTWNFCIHFRNAEFTLSKKVHFSYEREISVFINSTFHLANVEFSGKFHVRTRTSEAHRPDLINVFYGYYCTYTLLFLYYVTLSMLFI